YTGENIGDACAVGDQCGMTVHCAIPDLARRLVVRVAGPNEHAAQCRTQLLHGRVLNVCLELHLPYPPFRCRRCTRRHTFATEDRGGAPRVPPPGGGAPPPLSRARPSGPLARG